MAESQASSTSDKPPIENLGLAHLIPDGPPLDPVTTYQSVEIQPSGSSQNASDAGNDSAPDVAAVEISTTHEDDGEIGNSIERELFQLTISLAEIEAAERLETVDVEEEGKDADTVKKEEHLDEQKNEEHAGSGKEEDEGHEEGNDVEIVKGDHLDDESIDKDGESFEEENENEGVNEEEMNVGGNSGEAVARLGRQNHTNNRKRINYPMRPDAEDCAYYMKFGSCKFGLNCKFNHPPRSKNQGIKEKTKQREEISEKSGQTECKYYLSTGGCRYGKDCKYSHGPERRSAPQNPEFNFLGLPIRPGEKECPYYMRTGSCKYGSNCRFHHPEPTTVGGGSASGYDNGGSQHIPSSSISSWSPPRPFPDTSSFVPPMFPPNQAAHKQTSEWNGYQAMAYPTSERSLPTPPAFAINNLPSEMNFPMQLHDMVFEDYPERPGEPECNFFLKTGDCKYRSNCKFHHPRNRNSKAKTISFTHNDKGLPLRPDQPICTHYHRYGICKYGPACKYDHPSKFAILPPAFGQPPYSKVVDGAEKSGQGNYNESSM